MNLLYWKYEISRKTVRKIFRKSKRNGRRSEREALDLPDNKYYSVVTWSINKEAIGKVYISKAERVVKNKKVSKSDQKSNA